MNIGTITFQQPALSHSKKATVNNESKSGFSVNKAIEGNQTTSSTQKDTSTLYKELSSKYDVKNSTFEEVIEISNALYEAGEITLTEHALVTFDFERATSNLKRNAPGVPSNFNMYETSATSNGQRDWIAELVARAAKDFKFGNLIGFQSNKKVLDIFEKLVR